MPKFNPSKLKLTLKLAQTRLQMLQKRNENLSIQARKEIADLLSRNREEMARIRVEQIIRDDYLMETMEILEMYCALLSSRFGLIESVKSCDVGILEAVVTLIWSSPRMHEVRELSQIRDHFAARYGKDFVEQALENRNNSVHKAVIHKLSVHQPDPVLVEGYLKSIAEKYKVDWQPENTTLASINTSLPTVPSSLDAAPSVPTHTGTQPAFTSYNPGNFPQPGQSNAGYLSQHQQYQQPPQQQYPSVPQEPQTQQYQFPPQQQYQPQQFQQPPQQQFQQPPQQQFQQPPQQQYQPPQQPQQYTSTTSTTITPAVEESKIDPGFPSLPQAPSSTPPANPSASSSVDVPDFDELTRRFMALKQK